VSSSGPPLQGVLGAPAVRHSPSMTRDSSLSAGPSAAAAASGAASGQARSSAEARMGPTPGGASAALDAADAQLSGARAAMDGSCPCTRPMEMAGWFRLSLDLCTAWGSLPARVHRRWDRHRLLVASCRVGVLLHHF
jgi:hypothetical protein